MTDLSFGKSTIVFPPPCARKPSSAYPRVHIVDTGQNLTVPLRAPARECPINGGSGLVGLDDSSLEGYSECVEGGLPSHRPACSVSACGVEGSGGEVEALQGGRVVGEVPLGSDGASVAGVERLDRVGGVDHARRISTIIKPRAVNYKTISSTSLSRRWRFLTIRGSNAGAVSRVAPRSRPGRSL
jgi:hypothetical protein